MNPVTKPPSVLTLVRQRMIHPSLLSAIERPANILHAGWARDFVQKCKSSDSNVIDAAQFSARVQRGSSSSTEGSQPLIVHRPLLVRDADISNLLVDDNPKADVHKHVSVLPVASAESAHDSPSFVSKEIAMSPNVQSPYRSSPGSRTARLLSMRQSARSPAVDAADAGSPAKYFDHDELGQSSSREIHSLKAINRLQRHLESDHDGAVLSQLWCDNVAAFCVALVLLCTPHAATGTKPPYATSCFRLKENTLTSHAKA